MFPPCSVRIRLWSHFERHVYGPSHTHGVLVAKHPPANFGVSRIRVWGIQLPLGTADSRLRATSTSVQALFRGELENPVDSGTDCGSQNSTVSWGC